MRMNIKHLVLLFLVTCSNDSATAECNNTMLDAHASSSDIKLIAEHHESCYVTLVSPLDSQPYYNIDTVSSITETKVIDQQIKFVDMRIVPSEYLTEVRLKEDLSLDSYYPKENSMVIKITNSLIDPSAQHFRVYPYLYIF